MRLINWRAFPMLIVLFTGLLAAETGPRLLVQAREDRQVVIAWTDQAPGFALQSAPSLDSDDWMDVPGLPQAQASERSLVLPVGDAERFFRLRLNPLTTVLATSPRGGETGVAVTREVVIHFSDVLASTLIPGGDQVQVEASGRALLGRVELALDRRSLTWFPLEPMPSSARIRLRLLGDGLPDGRGNGVDLDHDGQAGGTGVLEFETLGTTGFSGTAVTGHVYASEPGVGGTNVPLMGVTVTVDGAEETLRTVTDAQGFFRLEPAPAGRFFVHVDGRTAVGSQWPRGAYYPVVGKAWEATVGRTNNLAGGTGLIFLPRIQAEALRHISATEVTPVGFVPEVLAANPALAGVEIRVPANALYSETGTRGGRVGIAPVPADRLPEPLPPGLRLPVVITIQTDGPQNFDQAVPVRFPNLPDPVTGMTLAPGARTVLWSFNHDTGRWEPQGTMTITTDGRFAETDAGVGVRQAGWHGAAPGSPGDGPGPHPCPDCDDDKDDEDPPGDDPWKRCKNEVVSSATSGADCAMSLIAGQAGSLKAPGPACGFGVGSGAVAAARDCTLDSAGCRLTLVNGLVGTAIGCAEFAAQSFGKSATRIGPIGQALGFMHGCLLGFGLNLCTAIDCVTPGSDAACAPDAVEDELFQWTNDWWDAINILDRQPLALMAPMAAGDPPGVTAALLKEARDRPALSQARLALALTHFFETLYGSPKWVGTDAASSALTAPLLDQLNQALDESSPGGITVTAAERALLADLNLPPGASTADLERLIQRMEQFFAGTLPKAELNVRALLGYGLKVHQMAEVYAAAGWTHELDGFRAGLVQLTDQWQSQCLPPAGGGGSLVGGGGGGAGGSSGGGGGGGAAVAGPNGRPAAPPRPLSWLLVNLEDGFLQRGHMQTGAALPSFILAPETFYGLYFVDEGTGAVAVSWFKSHAAGEPTAIPCALWLPAGSAQLGDADGDGLPDIAELAIGSDASSADSDDDGIVDLEELAGGTSPLDNAGLPVGTLAAANTPGTALGIAVAQDHAFIADDVAGLAVVRISDPRNPVLVAQVATPAPAVDVAADGTTAAVALGDGGLLIYDISSPAVPRLRHSILMPDVATVAVQGAHVLASSRDALVVFEVASGEEVARLNELPGGLVVEDIAVAGDFIHVLTRDRLTSVRLEGGNLFALGSVEVAGTPAPLETGRKLWVAGERAYVGYFRGYAIFSLANPGLPVLLGKESSTQSAVHSMTSAGPRLLTPVTSFAGPGTLAMSLYDVSDPTDVTRFLTSIDTPGEARALAIHEGLAWAADGSAGVAMVNFISRGSDKVLPTVTLGSPWNLAAPRSEPARLLRIPVDADDNTLVREVTLFLDGQRVDRDGSFPFALNVTTPAATPGKMSFSLQAVATDLNGNARTSAPVVVALVGDATPPALQSIYPPPGSTIPREFYTGVEVTLDEVPATIPPESIQVFSPGPDNTLGTADDVRVAGSVELRDRTLSWKPAVVALVGRFRVDLLAGIADAGGNVRSTTLSWTFITSNVRSQLSSVSPQGLLPTFDTTFSNIVATLSLALPPGRATEIIFQLTSAGPNGTLGNADDLTHVVTVIQALPAQVQLQVNPPLGIGKYRLRAQGPPVATRSVDFSLVDPRSIWNQDLSGRWSDATRWTRVPAAKSDVFIARQDADIVVTNTSDTPILSSVRCDERFVHLAGDFRVSSEATFDGPVFWGGDETVFDDAVLAQGVFRFRNLLEIRGHQVGNRRPHLGAATLINEGLATWMGETWESSSASSLFVNAAGAVFQIGGLAKNWIVTPNNSVGRMQNVGLIRKLDVNSVELQGGRMENQGRIVVEAGSLRMTRYSGAGAVEVHAGAIADLGHQPILPPGARISGAGRVIVGQAGVASTNRLAAVLRGAWEVSGVTESRGAGIRVQRSLDLPQGTFEARGDLSFDSVSRIGRLVVDSSDVNRSAAVNAALTVGELALRQGVLMGPATVAVTERMRVRLGSVDDGGVLTVTGNLTADGIEPSTLGTLRVGNRQLRLLNGTVETTNVLSILPLRAAATGGVRVEGEVRKMGSGTLQLGLNLTNAGILRVEAGTLTFRQGVDSGLNIALRSTLLQEPTAEFRLFGGTVDLQSTAFDVRSGIFGGAGTIIIPTGFGDAGLRIFAEFRPGNPGGQFTIGPGRLILIGTTVTTFEISENGTAEVRGGAQYRGRLKLRWTGDAPPSSGMEWRLFTGARSGTFSEVESEGLPADQQFEVIYLADGLIARVKPL